MRIIIPQNIKILNFVSQKSKIMRVPSKLTAYDLRKNLKVPKKKIKIVNEGVDLGVPEPPVLHEGINILCVARIAPNKGHDVLLSAFRTIKHKYPNSKLYLVGGISKDNKKYFQKLKDLVETFGINDVIFTNHMIDAELKMYYRISDIYVQPSIGEEGWGITITEAYCHRLPVVCTEIFRETGVADEERALVVRGGASDQLAEAIEVLIKDRSMREKISEKGYLFAKNLSWEKMSKNILHIVEEALK